MTSVSAPSSAWKVAKAGLVPEKVEITGDKGKKESCPAYSSKLRLFSYGYEAHGMLFDLLFAALKQTADRQAKQMGSTPLTHFMFTMGAIDKELDRYAEFLIQGLAEVPSENKTESKAESKGESKSAKGASEGVGPRFYALGPRLGLTLQKTKQLIEQSKKIWSEWFVSQAVSIGGKNAVPLAAATFQEGGKLELIAQSVNFLYAHFGLKSGGNVQFTSKDFEFFGITKIETVNNPALINCVQFALLTTREKRARDQIFYHTTFSPDKLLAALKKWGYKVVETAEAGDLAVYFDRQGVVVHAGVVRESGKILSKLGIINNSSHEHLLFDVPDGNIEKVCFFRKPAEED